MQRRLLVESWSLMSRRSFFLQSNHWRGELEVVCEIDLAFIWVWAYFFSICWTCMFVCWLIISPDVLILLDSGVVHTDDADKLMVVLGWASCIRSALLGTLKFLAAKITSYSLWNVSRYGKKKISSDGYKVLMICVTYRQIVVYLCFWINVYACDRSKRNGEGDSYVKKKSEGVMIVKRKERCEVRRIFTWLS